MLRDLSDEALMEKYREGDARAFEVLYKRYNSPLFNFILRHVANRASAEELLQEAFLRVIRGQKGFRGQSRFITWLYTIARNLCIDHLRRMKHRKAASLDQTLNKDDRQSQTLLDRIPNGSAGSDRKAMGKELRLKLEQAVSELPDEQREVFLLREVSQLSFKDIAEIVDCPENTVKSRMRYALERLRGKLSEFEALAREGA